MFELFDGEKTRKTFRFDKPSIIYITNLLAPFLKVRITKAKLRITPFDLVLISLQFYGTRTIQTVVGNVLKYSQATVGRSIHDVSRALCMIAHDHINFPQNLLQLKREFAKIARIPGIIGCNDGTHIKLQRRHQHEYAFVNRKGYHSINVQGVCDANDHFLSVNATRPGSVHDSTMFKTSVLGIQCAQGNLVKDFYWDSGYGCTTYLIPPFNIPSNDEEVTFNQSHKRTRCVFERAFRAGKRIFHCLHGEIRVQPQRACKIILACFVLNNIALTRKQPDLDDDIEEVELFECMMPRTNVPEPSNQQDARAGRLGFKK